MHAILGTGCEAGTIQASFFGWRGASNADKVELVSEATRPVNALEAKASNCGAAQALTGDPEKSYLRTVGVLIAIAPWQDSAAQERAGGGQLKLARRHDFIAGVGSRSPAATASACEKKSGESVVTRSNRDQD